MSGWFSTFRKRDRCYLRYRWWDDIGQDTQSIYLGALGDASEHPTAVLDTIVSKVMRMDASSETDEQGDRHLELLYQLRDQDKSWEALRGDGGT